MDPTRTTFLINGVAISLTDWIDDTYPIVGWEWGGRRRCHGFWVKRSWDSPRKRLAFIGLTPPGFPPVYSWSIDGTDKRGETPSLAMAKRRVERILFGS